MSDLDEFFARCDDVLDNWHGGTNAMLCEPSKGEVDLPRGESYYDQRTYWRPERPWTVEVETPSGWQDIGWMIDEPVVEWADPDPVVIREAMQAIRSFSVALAEWGATPKPQDERSRWERVMQTRRERNTGPVRDVRLDRQGTR